ncbi:hypothetical protein CPB83DRAFT_900442 [Crepidotus variabilis]|uniref:Uncharacterized protein n=1 Tax=Crepidotus variabilis TaxID=179855 RepID=A0A9P6E363_9AGAR|nr:hypothetical protein CPB83DRAFT_900442 [Crepidotus variabilis]
MFRLSQLGLTSTVAPPMGCYYTAEVLRQNVNNGLIEFHTELCTGEASGSLTVDDVAKLLFNGHLPPTIILNEMPPTPGQPQTSICIQGSKVLYAILQ